MKRKKINKKLVLKKETVASLANKDLQKINGGTDLTLTICLRCDPSFILKCQVE
jgi:hypothetical protein